MLSDSLLLILKQVPLRQRVSVDPCGDGGTMRGVRLGSEDQRMDPCEGISKIFSPIALSSGERGLVLLLGSDQGVKWSSRHLHTIDLLT